mmetsp:Transcript_9563/g.19565  ORF Transcript_9563/g.19565 Transcript_9563/m.19565 type:complete len:421 (-) Transcript_9563:1509-2771(-)|eukprot:CAMPEP_0184677536 /NCGR_PEP_ID=MMETSP0312-20130426/109_1 /TAXON_ID=31354 /ORGANISM="Compsopogon coeruleus, Strain SAG 36.94" /LENGTH=420 /DNA_ID=CAMNT_0027125449 /DNA_START=548 /DNA_END=1810 /DNA_ORIENTATION=+
MVVSILSVDLESSVELLLSGLTLKGDHNATRNEERAIDQASQSRNYWDQRETIRLERIESASALETVPEQTEGAAENMAKAKSPAFREPVLKTPRSVYDVLGVVHPEQLLDLGDEKKIGKGEDIGSGSRTSVSDHAEEDSESNRLLEWLDSDTTVDLEKLQSIAASGLPEQFRGQVWSYLLGFKDAVSVPDGTASPRHQVEYETSRMTVNLDDELARRVRGEVRRKAAKWGGDIDPTIYCRIICTHAMMGLGDADPSPSTLVSLALPIVHVFRVEWEAYFAYAALLHRHKDLLSQEGLSKAVANFITMARSHLPEMMEQLETEEVDLNHWVRSWLQALLVKQLPIECTLRLWDTYFATEDGLELHPYVCLAILDVLQEDIMELESVEAMGFLDNLPPLDIDQVITKAHQARVDIAGNGIL